MRGAVEEAQGMPASYKCLTASAKRFSVHRDNIVCSTKRFIGWLDRICRLKQSRRAPLHAVNRPFEL